MNLFENLQLMKEEENNVAKKYYMINGSDGKIPIETIIDVSLFSDESTTKVIDRLCNDNNTDLEWIDICSIGNILNIKEITSDEYNKAIDIMYGLDFLDDDNNENNEKNNNEKILNIYNKLIQLIKDKHLKIYLNDDQSQYGRWYLSGNDILKLKKELPEFEKENNCKINISLNELGTGKDFLYINLL